MPFEKSYPFLRSNGQPLEGLGHSKTRGPSASEFLPLGSYTLGGLASYPLTGSYSISTLPRLWAIVTGSSLSASPGISTGLDAT